MVTCESSLFSQRPDNYNFFARKKLLLHYRTPTLQRHGPVWVYHFLEQQHVTLRCWKNGAWISRPAVLAGRGVLQNASGCSVAASGFQTLSDLLCVTQETPDAPRLYVPDKIALKAGHELQEPEETKPSEITRLDEVTSEVMAACQITDVNHCST
jgi:hypothetical protein